MFYVNLEDLTPQHGEYDIELEFWLDFQKNWWPCDKKSCGTTEEHNNLYHEYMKSKFKICALDFHGTVITGIYFETELDKFQFLLKYA